MGTASITLVSVFILTQWSCGGKGTPQSAANRNTSVGSTESVSSAYKQIEEKIAGIVAKQVGIEAGSVDVNAPLSKQPVAADDLDAVEIVMSVEEEFNIEIKDEEVGDSITDSLSVKKLAEIVFTKKKP
jgi:acyl carrier protein